MCDLLVFFVNLIFSFDSHFEKSLLLQFFDHPIHKTLCYPLSTNQNFHLNVFLKKAYCLGYLTNRDKRLCKILLKALISTDKHLKKTYCLGFTENRDIMSCQQLTSSETERSIFILSTSIVLVLWELMS